MALFNPFPNLQYPKLKLTILMLLALNALIYSLVDTLTGAIDAIAWLMLLILYEVETNQNNLPISAAMLKLTRNSLITLIVLVFFSYLFTGEWLDVLNTMLWLSLVALLELEVRWQDLVMRHRRIFWLLTVTTFCGLMAIAGIWFLQGAILDGYDAVLWIAAFGLVEVDIFHFLQRRPSSS
jgi:hypothetical protein